MWTDRELRLWIMNDEQIEFEEILNSVESRADLRTNGVQTAQVASTSPHIPPRDTESLDSNFTDEEDTNIGLFSTSCIAHKVLIMVDRDFAYKIGQRQG